jgi:hypothetical protein
MRVIPSIRSLLFALVMLAMSAASFAQVSISISFAPPALPVYEQPLCPGEGYLWTPGYWAYANDFDDYYWVPGTWVMAPEVGFLWTPGYWGWGGSGFVFHDGYWGPTVGFYGGISYGYGYFGQGYEGGRWQNGQFYYNRSVNNVNITNIHNVYNTTVINTTTVNRVSYNGGDGGINARPRPEEEAAARGKHIPPVAVQTQHIQAARAIPELRASENHGKPTVAATPKPGEFKDRAVVPAKEAGAPYNHPSGKPVATPAANTPVAHPENNAARPDHAESKRPLTAQPNNQPDRPSAAQPNNRSVPNRNEPAQPTAQPNNRPDHQPAAQNNRPETIRPATPQPNNRPDSNSPPTAQPNNRPDPNRDEPVQRSQTPPPIERSQPQRTPPPAEMRPAAQEPQRAQPAAQMPEEKKPQEKQPKKDEKPPQ